MCVGGWLREWEVGLYECLDTISPTELSATSADCLMRHSVGDTIDAEEAADRDTQASTLSLTVPHS